jgi:hypothetical protein
MGYVVTTKQLLGCCRNGLMFVRKYGVRPLGLDTYPAEKEKAIRTQPN